MQSPQQYHDKHSTLRPNPVSPSNMHIPREHTVYIQYFWSKAQKDTPGASVKKENVEIEANRTTVITLKGKNFCLNCQRHQPVPLLLEGRTVNQHSALPTRNNTGMRRQQPPRTPDELAPEIGPPDVARFSIFLYPRRFPPSPSLLLAALSWKQMMAGKDYDVLISANPEFLSAIYWSSLSPT